MKANSGSARNSTTYLGWLGVDRGDRRQGRHPRHG
jgi:hypothetical protein